VHIKRAERIIIGTASFASTYGIANQNQVSTSEINRIIDLSAKSGVFGFDTAPTYGSAEEAISEAAGKGLKLISKIPAGCRSYRTIYQSVQRSIELLKAPCLEAVLFHDSKDLLDAKSEARTSMMALMEQGLIKRWGVSVYEPDELIRSLDLEPMVIQAPMNFFDRRFLEPSILKAAQHAGVELHFRSIFLQGFLLMNEQDLPGHLLRWTDENRWFGSLAQSYGLSRHELAVAFALSALPHAKLVVGVNSLRDLEQLLAVIGLPEIKIERWLPNEESPLELIDPRRWVRDA
jgi:aryl-alcohol dehydrogenase-like predicted oxidoreductase